MGRGRRVLRALCLVVGWVLVAVALDLGVGAALEALRPRPDAGSTLAVPRADTEVVTGSCPPGQELSPDSRTRSTHPAYDEPWVREWWCEFDRVREVYTPYLFSRHLQADQALIHEADGVRRSYQAADLLPDAPTIWFFGGSTMWGWGQRDDHTIPSEVARLAEDAGAPVRVVNFGQLAWVHWQGVLAFEQELADRPAPDLVVFYDGVNDVNVQMPTESAWGASARPGDDPTIYDFDQDPPAPVPGPFDALVTEPVDESWADWWSDHSGVARLGGSLAGLVGMQPASAQEADDPSSDPAAIAERVVAVYERGRVLAEGAARRHDVRALYVWQPRLDQQTLPSEVDAEARRRLDPAVVDLGGAFDGHDLVALYTDDAHHTETGAALVAEALWPHLRQALDARDGSSP